MSKEDIKLEEELVDEEETETDTEDTQDESAEEEETKTYSQEEVDKLLQAESDRRVTKALKKKEQEFQAKLQEETSEAEKLASMSAEERAMAEFKKEKEAWEEEKKKFERERMQLEATKLLSSEGLPVTFVDYVVGDTAEEVTENITTFKEEWKKALEDAVADKLKGRVPTGSSLQTKDIMNMTKEEFGKLPYRERTRMLDVDPDIVSKLKD